jgi:hypothetical protein
MTWTTLVEPDLSRPHMGSRELHMVCLLPKGWPGKGACVSLEIPECKLIVCLPQPNGEPVVIVNQPFNNNIKTWVRRACETACEYHACITFHCDTGEQAERAAKLAGRSLPNYERVALERMYGADTRRLRDNLS